MTIEDKDHEGILPAPRYLGDGAYASFDGYQIWLAANDHRNLVIALEPAVWHNLLGYAKSIGGPFDV